MYHRELGRKANQPRKALCRVVGAGEVSVTGRLITVKTQLEHGLPLTAHVPQCSPAREALLRDF